MTGFVRYHGPADAPNTAAPAQQQAAPAATQSAAGMPGFKPRQFESTTVDPVAEIAKKAGQGRFRLDHNVAQTLAIEETERQRIEQRIKEEIEKRWSLVKEKAEVEGYTTGLNQGKAEAYKAEKPRIEEKLARFDQMLQELDQFRERIFQANEAFLMEIISQVCRMVLLKELAVDKEYLHRIVTHLLQQLSTKEDVRVLISEADKDLLESLKLAIEKEFGALKSTVLETSPDIKTGGCKVETRYGVIDASVSAQIENVLKALKN